MSQKIYHNYQDAMTSDDFNYAVLGLMPPGRYCGFDTISSSGLNFSILHTTTGQVVTKFDGSASNQKGILLTKQGMVVQEDATLTGLVCISNSGLGNRIDAVVMVHAKVNTPGGAAATYKVIQGTPTMGVPALDSPNTEILIGTISIPANATDLSAAVYAPTQIPNIGNTDILTAYPLIGQTFASLTGVNAFTQQQQLQYSNTAITAASNKWTPLTTANAFKGGSAGALIINEIASVRNGLMLVLKAVTNTITLNINSAPTVGGLKVRSSSLEAASIGTLVMQDGDIVILQQFVSEWRIISMADALQEQLNILNEIPSWQLVQGGIGFQNSWSDVGGGEPQARFKKENAQFVVLSGTCGGGATNTTAFTLPAGYRPTQLCFYMVPMPGDISKLAIVAVTSAGVVNIKYVSGTTEVSLEGIRIPLD